MKNLMLVLFLLLFSCELSKNKEFLDEFAFNEQEQALKQNENGNSPFVFAFRERARLENGDWYRAKVFLVNDSIPLGYLDSTAVKFLPDSASYEEVLKNGVNAVVVGDTGYVKFKAYQQNITKGDSVLKQWTAIYINPAIPNNRTYKIHMEYLLKGK